MKDEKIKPYKPLSAKSKFLKPNEQGQVPAKCINFSFCGKHCQRFVDGATSPLDEIIMEDCKVLKGVYCDRFE